MADLRAPTPSAAAELAVPEYNELMTGIENKAKRIKLIPESNLKIKKSEFDRIAGNAYFTKPEKIIEDAREKLEHKSQMMMHVYNQKLLSISNKIDNIQQRLEALNPNNVLSRGYSIVYGEDGHIVTDSESVDKGNQIKILTGNGEFEATVR